MSTRHTLHTRSSGVVGVGMCGLVGVLALGCGPSPAARPVGVPENAVRVVRADEVKRTCACDDDDLVVDGDADEARAAKPVQYVKERALLNRCLAQLKLPDLPVANGESSKPNQHRAAAQSRWTQAHGGAS